MPDIKLNARDLIVEVSNGVTPTPTWLQVAGLTKFVPKPGENEETADTTDYNSGGNYEEEVMQRGYALEVEGFKMGDSVTGAQSPGQARVEALAALVGPASRGSIRFRHILDTTWKVWVATVRLKEQGGEVNDKGGWGATFVRCGASTTVSVT